MFGAASPLLREAAVPAGAGARAGGEKRARGRGVSYRRQSKLAIRTANAEVFARRVCSAPGARSRVHG